MRRVTQTRFGAALPCHGQIARRAGMDLDRHCVVVDLHQAKVRIVFLLTRWAVDLRESTGGLGRNLDAVAVQVVAWSDRPVQRNSLGAACRFTNAQYECLFSIEKRGLRMGGALAKRKRRHQRNADVQQAMQEDNEGSAQWGSLKGFKVSIMLTHD